MRERVPVVELSGRPEIKDRLPAVSKVELFITEINAEITDDATRLLAEQNATETREVLQGFRNVENALDTFRRSPNADTVLKDRTIVDYKSYSRLYVKSFVDALALKSVLDTLANSCVSLFKKLSNRGRHAEGSTRFASILDYFNEVLGCNFASNYDGTVSIQDSLPQPGYESAQGFNDRLGQAGVTSSYHLNLKPLYFALKVEELCSDQQKLEEFIAKF